MKWCQEPRCSPLVRPVCQGPFGVALRVPNIISHLKTEHGTTLETLEGQGPHLAMTGDPRGFSQVEAEFSNYYWEFRLPLVLAQG